jgi:hypothetical protein
MHIIRPPVIWVILLLCILVLGVGLVFVFRYNNGNLAYLSRNKVSEMEGQASRTIKFTLVPLIAGSVSGATPSPAEPEANPSPPATPTAAPVTTLLPAGKAIHAPLRVDTQNRRYFADSSGSIVYLTGSHTWANLQDNGMGYPPPVFNYTQYLDWLQSYNHNFFRLWTWEQSRWTMETADDSYWFDPLPYPRSGPDTALDGQLKFDLAKFNPAYFDRMRSRVIEAGDRGMYVSIMLFDGWSIASDKDGYHLNNPWNGHPFHSANNINTIDGDPNHRGDGINTQDLSIPAVTAIQEAYVRKVIDTVGDLDNVLYEIANEADATSVSWQYHMINLIKTYEAGRAKQHPVGMTAPYPGGWNPDLLNSPADWISPNNDIDFLGSPPLADGKKVIIVDTDHLCGVCGDRQFVWKNFTRGMNPIFMDVFDGAGYGVGAETFQADDPAFVDARKNMGYTRSFASRMNLHTALPSQDRCSTGYCLVSLAQESIQFLVYAPDGGSMVVDLSGAQAELRVEWFNPHTGESTPAGVIQGGGNHSFVPPFSGDAVLFIYQ